MSRAAINILGSTGEIIEVASLGKADITCEHAGPGHYLVHGTQGLVPAPEGWGYALNTVDRDASIAIAFDDDVLAVTATVGGQPADLQHSITLHVAVEALPPIQPPPPTKPEPSDLLLLAQQTQAQLREIADYHIAPLQDAVDLEEATEEEAVALKAWKKYRIALSRVHDQEGYPTSIDWPQQPA